MTPQQEVLEQRFPLYIVYPKRFEVGFGPDGLNLLQKKQRASDLRRVAAELTKMLPHNMPTAEWVKWIDYIADLEALADRRDNVNTSDK